MLGPTSAVMGRGLGKDVAFITDGRFSGGTHGFVVGHITPEAHAGGPLAIVKNGDSITIDATKRKITLEVPQAEIAARLAKWKAPKPRYTRGVLAKYAATVSSATFQELPSRGPRRSPERRLAGTFPARRNAVVRALASLIHFDAALPHLIQEGWRTGL